ncbi:MAG: iron-containing alcohol dehydrogenase [Candidatus Magnetomorum sp.]|nr:iron-containing alcohol dehydrogenase [Candidatus Magnetomorum sp.]
MIWTLKKASFRIFHMSMKLGAMVLPFPVPKLITGPGSVKKLADQVKADGLSNVLVVTDRVLMGLNVPENLLKSLEAKGIQYKVFDDVQPNPTIHNIENGLQHYRLNKCDGIIAIGGGSPIDCAKVIGARLVNPSRSVRQMRGTFKLWKSLPPFYAIPTTAGTGSETTLAAVVTDSETHEKYAISSLPLVPKYAVLDPELMIGLPPHITSTTGMDALTHAVEAYIGLNGNRFTDKNACDATKLIFDNLEKVYENGSDIDGRNNMALASFYAGTAFTRAYVGYVHAIAHNMGGMYGVPHGLANAIILPYILDFCQVEAEKKLAKLAIAGGLGTSGEPQSELAQRFIDKVRSLNQNMGIPSYIKELQEKDIPLIAERALYEAHPDYPVPRIMTQKECEDIIRQLMP